MTQAIRFLNRLAGAFSNMALYGEGHPAREQAMEAAADDLQALLAEDPQPRFTFLEEDVIYGDQPLEGMRNWTLGRHLARRSIQRIEIDLGVSRSEFRAFLEEAAIQLSRPPEALQAAPILCPHIRFGELETGERIEEEATPFDLAAEAGKVDWLHEEALVKGRISASLARAVVQTLSTAMRYTRKILVPLISLKEVDQYSTIHSMNTSMLSMALGEFLRLGGPQVRVIGEAALLHDMGKVNIPLEILNKEGPPTPEEWAVIRRHPLEGARILLRSGNDLDLAAIAAYEHHLRWDGGGYPEVHYRRRPHRLAQLVHICDTYDAMRTRRPHQGPLPHEQILSVLQAGAGSEYNPDLVAAFLGMLGQWSSRIVEGGEIGPSRRRDLEEKF
jgi:HD-GYP domain-containing protein (c-di-GMP phosphodiesterase class II)